MARITETNNMNNKVVWIALAPLLLIACQSESPPPDATAAAPKPVADVAAGQKLAEKCASCHGVDGADVSQRAPFLAGQNLDYLQNALLAYTDGRREHAEKKTLLQPLSTQDLLNVAGYYAQLSTPWKGAVAPPQPQARAFDANAVAAGKAASTHCQSCHGAAGNSVKPAVPSLAGLQPEYFTVALKAYFSGGRGDPIMHVFKESLDGKEITNIAAYFANQTRVKSTDVGSGNAAAGKALSGACAGCHGGDGNSINPAIPTIAGQNAAFQEKALLAYQSGQRKDGMMQAAVKGLKPNDVRNLAAFYASQAPRRFGESAPAVAGAFDPVGDGARLAANCSGCHGDNGNSEIAGIPSLNRLHSDYLVAAIKAYRDGARKNATMKNFVLYLSDEDVVKLALYYATQEPLASALKSKGDASAGEQIAAACNGCHGGNGNSTTPATPSLAGQDAAYLIGAVKEYAGGGRAHADMQNAVKELKDADVANVAAYYAAQTPVKPEVRLPEAPEVLAQKCNRCHGEDGRGTIDPAKPRLAGQYEPYLIHALHQYRAEQRKSGAMHAMSDVLSEMEINAIAAYYARE
jgi:cytochrome c553